jgi:hypothetical protein
MPLQNEEVQLASAWRALSGKAEGRGWKAIEIFSSPRCLVLAGRKGNGNEESLLIGIAGAPAPDESQLPRSQGFVFVRTDLAGDTSGHTWFALSRKANGQLPMFTLMAADLTSLVAKVALQDGPQIYTSLIARIRGWQEFMKRDRSGVLSADEEVGLIGELHVLMNLIAGGLSPVDAVDAWVGPDDGLHDFVIGTGGVEAKTTVAPVGFIAEIGSLDQLDDALYRPLYVAALRLSQSATGKTLPEHFEAILEETRDAGVAPLLESRLLSAGYVESMREHYTRRFILKELTYRLIDESSPRLTRSNVPVPVHRVQYSLDLDSVPVVASNFREISNSLGLSN